MKNRLYVGVAFICGALVLMITLILLRSQQGTLLVDQQNYLLTVTVTAATLATIVVAIMSLIQYVQYKEVIGREVEKQVGVALGKLSDKMSVQQEIVQKMSVVYGIEDPEQKIELLHEVLILDDKAYNAKITLGYVYWYDKKDLEQAKEYFMDAYSDNREKHQAASDLAALYWSKGDRKNTSRWIERAKLVRADIEESLMKDSRFNNYYSSK